MKKILITGASGDLGFAIAKKFAEESGKSSLLILHCNGSVEKAKQNALFLEKNFGCKTEIVKCNLCDVDATEQMCKTLLEKHGKIDILINNAAMVVDADLEERSAQIFENTLRCNLLAPFILSKAFGAKMNVCGGVKSSIFRQQTELTTILPTHSTMMPAKPA